MLHVTWILFVTFYLKFSVFSSEKCMCPLHTENRECQSECSMGCLPINIFIRTVCGNVVCEGSLQSDCGYFAAKLNVAYSLFV